MNYTKPLCFLCSRRLIVPVVNYKNLIQPLSAYNQFLRAQSTTNTNYFKSKKSYHKDTAIFVGASLASWVLYSFYNELKECNLQALSKKNEIENVIGKWIIGLPVYSADQVAEHGSKEDGIWVTYGEAVYDITKFVDKHPGGDKILMAAGGSVEPFWLLYAVHKDPSVLNILEEYRIGNLSKEDVVKQTEIDDPFANEPRRHPALIPARSKPYNAETPLSLLIDSYITPSELFYVRNHLPVPVVDASAYQLEITGIGLQPIKLSLHDLKTKFPKHTITATIQCGGNRRSEMMKIKNIEGLSWKQGAIGNATWTGVRLYDVLKAAGYTEASKGAEHVQFEGLDKDITNMAYGASVPIDVAMNPKREILLAYEMNGQPLSIDHGFPIRVVVPGVVGARSVKWLGKIVVSDEESQSHWQRNDYKVFPPSVGPGEADYSKVPALQDMPVVSAICEPENGKTVERTSQGNVMVKGYAWSGGGQKILRVDVSSDCGKTWHPAQMVHQDKNSKAPQNWAWILWQAEIPINPRAKQVEIWCKAVDSSHNTQPESFQNIWNLRGLVGNAYHRVTVKIAN